MANEDIKGELSALRAEVAALAAARQAQTEASKAPEPPPSDVALAESDEKANHEGGFMGEVQELVELLEHEMRETPMVTGLVVFSLGVLFGRFLR